MFFKVVARLGGGIGDHVCMTSIVSQIKKKVFVITDKPEVFFNNPNIRKIIVLKNQKINRVILKFLDRVGLIFYFSFRKNKKYKTLEEYVKKNPKKHYIEVNSLHLKNIVNYDTLKNKIYFSEKEVFDFDKKYNFLPKEYYLIHSEGKISYTPNKSIDVNIFNKIIDTNKNINFVQIGCQSEKSLNVKNEFDLRGKTTLRELFYLISTCKGIISLEGGYNHIANCFSKQSITIFTGFNPNKLCKYDNTLVVQNKKLPSCAPCMKEEKCDKNMACNNYNIVKEVNRYIN